MFIVGSVQKSYLEDNRCYEFSQFSVGHNHGKFLVEKELEVGL
jgi:hypothetical protein